MEVDNNDEFLEKALQNLDSLMSEGRMSSAGKIIPIHESLDCLNWVLPTNQALEYIRNARSFAVQNCFHRVKYKRCNNPVDVCLLINDYADKAVSVGKAWKIDLSEAIEKLKVANKYGLVHLALHSPNQDVIALCSCCECCCDNLQMFKRFKRPDVISRSDYIAVVDKDKCTNCGKCAERCMFGAQVKNGEVEYHPEYCYGCGLCVTTCPTNAISLKLRR